ncbi:MAG: alpha/beta hydrolase [Blastocatellia bacterium]|jgi:phospholipase/carboxylesterase
MGDGSPFRLIHRAVPPRDGLATTSDAAGLGEKGRPPLLLLLHGYGANEEDLFSLASYVDPRFLVVSPRAPITLAPGAYAWFNLGLGPQGFEYDSREVRTGLDALGQFLDEVRNQYQVDPSRVFLLGFSQGAMMALQLALTHPGLAAGVVALSGRALPNLDQQLSNPEALRGFPIFVAHGTIDAVLPIHHGRETRAVLSQLPVELDYHEYPMGHEITPESFRDASGWLTRHLDR